MNSAEIAQMLAAQNSMFMGQRSFASQIGLPSPMGQGGFQRDPGNPGAPPVWSYAPGGHLGPGYQTGNQVAGSAMSMMGAGMKAGQVGLGLAGGFGAMGALGMAFDPFSAGAAGFRSMGVLGAGMGAAVPLGIGMAASSFGHHFIQGGQHQQRVSNQLGQFQFFNPQSRTGMGFSRDDTQAIGSQMRAMSHLPEMMTSMDELTRMLPKLKSSGMMQGVKDASEFAQRFKESIKTIREVSKVLGTTMEEAADFFAHSRSVGFLGKQSQLQNVMNTQFTSGVTGMSTGQVMGMQQAGADMALQIGAKRSLGASAVTNIAQSLGLAQRQGVLKEGALEEITGLQGPEAIQAASQRFAGVLANVARSSAAGRLSIAGMVKFDENGKALGIDEDLARAYREGTISMGDLKKRAGRLTHAQKISFHTRQSDLAMEFAGKTGPQGIASFLEGVAGDRFGSEGVNLLLQRHGGLSASEADVMQGMVGMGSGEGDFKAMAKIRAREAHLREKMDPSAVMKRIKTRIHSSVFGGVEEQGAKIFTEIGKAYDQFIDDLVGRHVVTLSKEGADNLARAMAGGSKKELEDMFKAASGMGATAGGFKRPGTLGKMGASMMMGGPMGAAIGSHLLGADMLVKNAGMLRDTELGAFLMRGSTDTGRSSVGQEALAKQLFGGDDIQGMGSRLNKGAGMFGGGSQAARMLSDMAVGIDGYRDMSSARLSDELRSKISGTISSGTQGASAVDQMLLQRAMAGDDSAIEKISGSGGLLEKLEKGGGSQKKAAVAIRAGLAGRKQFGSKVDFATAAIAAGQGSFSGLAGQVDFTAIGSAGASAAFTSTKERQEAMRGATDALEKSGLGGQTLSLLRTNPEARKAVALALEDSSVAEALRDPDPSSVVKKLRDKGINISSKDVRAIQDAADDARKNQGKGKDVLGSIKTLVNAKAGEDLAAFAGGFRDAADSLDTSLAPTEALAKSLSAAASAIESGDQKGYSNRLDEVRKNLSNLSSAISTAKGPEREALIKAAGRFGDIAADIDRRGKGLVGRRMDAEGFAQKMGVSLTPEVEEQLKALGIERGKSTTIDKTMLDKAKESILGVRGAGVIAGKGSTTSAGDKDAQMIETLKKMQIAANAQTELLSLLVADGNGDKAKKAAETAMRNARDDANSSSSGSTNLP